MWALEAIYWGLFFLATRPGPSLGYKSRHLHMLWQTCKGTRIFKAGGTMNSDTPGKNPPSLFAQKAMWLIGLGLLANAGVMLYSHTSGRSGDLLLDRSAFAQASPEGGTPLLGARGIYMAPAQLGPTTYGLYLMDVDAGTICVYKALPDTSRFRLMAARSFKNDRYLEDYDNEGILPRDVQKVISNQRQRQSLESQNGVPTVDQSVKPDENKPDAPPAQ